MSRTADQDTLSSQLTIKVAGTAIGQTVFNDVLDVVVDQHAHLPAMFTIRLIDADITYVNGRPFDLGKEVEISAAKGDGSSHPLIKGEITALEPQFLSGRISYLVVRGYDKLHRLYREVKTVAHKNKKDSDIASAIAGAAGLSAQVDATTTTYEHLFQYNQSDMAFLMQRAWRIGFECFAQEGKLYFRKPPAISGGASLTWGEDLQTFEPRATLAEQVSDVEVRGWDMVTMEAVVGKASASSDGKLYSATGDSKKGYSWAGSFGTGKYIITDQPVVDKAEADTLAKARMNEISGANIEAAGTAFRRPDVIAGKVVKIEGVGTRFNGNYLVTKARHRYSHEGLYVDFEVLGARTGLLAELITRPEPVEKWPGVVTAVVTDTDDPEGYGRIKVKYPWLDDSQDSGWARVVGAGAGPEAGFFCLPDVGDEVLVSFEQGDFNYPIVLGGLWNGQNKLPPDPVAAAKGEIPLVRSWRGRNGHYITMFDNDADNKIHIETAAGMKLEMNDKDKKLTIETTGGQTIVIDDNGSGTVTVEGNGSLKVKAGMDISIEAGTTLTLKGGAGVSVDGGPSVTVKGGTVAIN